MQLTRYTDYALRVLLYLGAQPERVCPIAEISQAYGLSQNHLMKIVHDLGQKGYLDNVRGRNGGICLRRKPQDMSARSCATSDDLNVLGCLGQTGYCQIERVCVLRRGRRSLSDIYGSVVAVGGRKNTPKTNPKAGAPDVRARVLIFTVGNGP